MLDESKPPVPYVKGWRFSVRSHIPPPPTPFSRKLPVNDDAGTLERSQLHPVERCVRNSPLPGSDGSSFIDLEIVDTLNAGDECNAQVVVVEVKSDPCADGLAADKRLAAKFYDPLYYDDDDGYLNPFFLMDKFYTHEAAAYTALSDLQGSLIPKYFGSFSLDIPVADLTMRSVRLILIEYIAGSTMIKFNPGTLSQEVRQNLIKAIVDFDTLLYTRALIHRDIHPRNIILVNTTRSDELIRPVFIDFGDVDFGHSPFGEVNPKFKSFLRPGVYISPLLRWHDVKHRHHKYRDWIDWDWQSWLETEYGHTAGSITGPMRNFYLPQYLLKLKYGESLSK